MIFLSITAAKRLSSKTTNLGEFLKCIILIPVQIWASFMAIKMQKFALLEVFHLTAKTKFNEKRAEMLDRFTELYWNSLNADTATRVDFTITCDLASLISVVILVYHGGTPIWRCYTGLCKFLQTILTNIWSLGRRTGLKLGQVSYILSLSSQFRSFLHWIVFD